MYLATFHHWWVSVIFGSLLCEFICHRSCPYTTAPEGRLDTLHWLSLPLSVFPVPLYLQPLSVALSPINIPSLLLSLSLSSISFSLRLPTLPSRYLPVCAPLSQYCEQVTVGERGGPPGSAMRGTDGPPCPFSKTVDRCCSIKMHDVFQSSLPL